MITFVDVEVRGARVDVAVAHGRVTAVAAGLPRSGHVVDGGGGALLPGLHDHHLHLLAMAAAVRSLDLAAVPDAAGLDAAIRAAHAHLPAGDWLRAVGLDDRHGPLHRERLDALAPDRPVRVQHRSGAAWVLGTAGLRVAGVDPGSSPDGWLHRHDEHLGRSWRADPPDLAPVGRHLAAMGVTGVTDATPYDDASAWAVLADARARGDLPQHVAVTGGPGLAATPVPPGLARGPVKVLVADDALPSPDHLATALRTAHAAGRPVAVHCVSRVGLVLALTAWEHAGAVPGDRIEHGSVIPLELVATVADLGLRVVTQPAFVRSRGDAYLAQVEADDLPHLYRCRSLLDAGIGVAGSTDAPFGPADPWLAVAAAADRRTPAGHVLGADERVAARRALDLFLAPLHDPTGPPRRIEPGADADLCLLDAPLATVLGAPSSEHVRACWIDGRPSPR